MVNLSFLDEIIEKLKENNKKIEKALLSMGESVPKIDNVKNTKSIVFKTDVKKLK